jgi:hypothetical protein
MRTNGMHHARPSQRLAHPTILFRSLKSVRPVFAPLAFLPPHKKLSSGATAAHFAAAVEGPALALALALAKPPSCLSPATRLLFPHTRHGRPHLLPSSP